MVELLVVIAIIGILSGILGVTWNKFSDKMRVTTAIRDLRSSVIVARSDAMTRKRYSGIVIDFSGRKFMRFVDSSATAATTRNCRYEIGETILQTWMSLPPQVQVFQSASSISPDPPIRKCDVASSAVVAAAQTGAYAVVFRPDGSSCAALSAKIGITGFPSDTFRLTVQPPAGLVTLEK